MAATEHLGVQFGVGDVVHVPPFRRNPGGAVTVTKMGKHYFEGELPSGEHFGKTGIHLPEGFRGEGREPKPWEIEHKGG